MPPSPLLKIVIIRLENGQLFLFQFTYHIRTIDWYHIGIIKFKLNSLLIFLLILILAYWFNMFILNWKMLYYNVGIFQHFKQYCISLKKSPYKNVQIYITDKYILLQS
jgi:hypothetical protein